MRTATDNGADNSSFDNDDAANGFMNLWKTDDAVELSDDEDEEKKKPKPTSDDEDEDLDDDDLEGDESDEDEDEPEDDEDDTDEDSDEEDEGKKPKRRVADDDYVVSIKVDGKEVEASVKDLKRLYGQEAALTRKSQEVATERKRIDDNGAKYVGGLERLLTAAQAEYEPYSQIDFLALAKDPEISGEELSALRKEAQRAYEKVTFLTTDLNTVLTDAAKQRTASLQSQAREAVKVLSDPKTGIPGWSESLYNDIRSNAISEGLDASLVNELTDPAAIKLLHAALLYKKGQSALGKTNKVNKTPKKIIKSSANADSTSRMITKGTANKAMQKLRSSGTVDDAADAFMAKWSN